MKCRPDQFSRAHPASHDSVMVPGHGFHQNERGQTRYTISLEARREVLRRLLELNLEVGAKQAGKR